MPTQLLEHHISVNLPWQACKRSPHITSDTVNVNIKNCELFKPKTEGVQTKMRE